jgi:ribosomal protein S4E
MKQLTCEMCGSTELIKNEGVFVCQSCGTKYSVEEAKKMIVEGTVQIEGTVRVDNSANVRNFLDVAENALSGGNGKEAYEYANKALEINPKSSGAWIVKMKSLETIGTIGDPRCTEVINCGKSAIDFATNEQCESALNKTVFWIYFHIFTNIYYLRYINSF